MAARGPALPGFGVLPPGFPLLVVDEGALLQTLQSQTATLSARRRV